MHFRLLLALASGALAAAAGTVPLELTSANPREVPEDRATELTVEGTGLGPGTHVVPATGGAFFLSWLDIRAFDVEVAGQVAYVAASRGLKVVDVADPANPVELGTASETPMRAVAISGDRLFAAGIELEIFDITDRRNPRLLGSARSVCSGERIVIADPAVYMTCAGGGGIVIFDVTDAQAPRFVRHLEPFGGRRSESRAIEIVGDVAFVTDEILGLVSLDISSPFDPVMIATAAAPHRGFGLDVDGTFAYVADSTRRRLLVYDVSRPDELRLVGSTPTLRTVVGVRVVDGFAYVTDTGNAGLAIYDVQDPTDPFLSYVTGSPILSALGFQPDVVDGVAYVADLLTGFLQIFDVRNPEPPGLLGRVKVPFPRDTALADGLAHVASTEGLWVVDLGKPEQPVVLGATTGFVAHRIVVDDRTAYVTTDAGVRLVDVKDPERPFTVGRVSLPGDDDAGRSPGARQIAVKDEVVFAVQVPQLVVIDASDPATPVVIDRLPIHSGEILLLEDDLLLLASSPGLRVLDVSDPRHPEEVGFLDTGDFVRDIAGSGDIVALVTRRGLRIVDLSEPAAPRTVGELDVGGPRAFTLDVTLDRDIAHVAILLGNREFFNLMVDISDPISPRPVGGSAHLGSVPFIDGFGLRVLNTGVQTYRIPPPIRDAFSADAGLATIALPRGLSPGSYHLLGLDRDGGADVLHDAFRVLPEEDRSGPGGHDRAGEGRSGRPRD